MNERVNGKKINYSVLINILLCVFVLWILKGFFFRLVRGVDTSDESFYAAMAYRLAEGNALFKDMWEPVGSSALLPSVFLRLLRAICGGTDGVVFFFRLGFFFCNLFAAYLLYVVQKRYVGRRASALLALFYLIYAPFHIYTFSYNNLSDMFFMITVCFFVLGYENENGRFYFCAGVSCALLALTYPTMLLMCACMWIESVCICTVQKKRSWLYFSAGGLATALVFGTIILYKAGFDGFIGGINGILMDPAYGGTGSAQLGARIVAALLYFAEPFKKCGVLFTAFWLVLLILAFIKKKFPAASVVLFFYPAIICGVLDKLYGGTLSMGNYIFLLAMLFPLLFLYITEDRALMGRFFLLEWLPGMMYYLVLSASSAGGPGQAVQGLVVCAVVALKGIVLVLRESGRRSAPAGRTLLSFVIAAGLMLTVVLELNVYGSVVYRDSDVRELDYQVRKGPYKGLYTVEQRRDYLEELSDVFKTLEEPGKSAMVLYHSNFAYLMLNMRPAAPTAWGIYTATDNEPVFMEYMRTDKDHIPDCIYIVDVPRQFDYDFQRREYYTFCRKLNKMIKKFYSLQDTVELSETGVVEKYVRNGKKITRFLNKK